MQIYYKMWNLLMEKVVGMIVVPLSHYWCIWEKSSRNQANMIVLRLGTIILVGTNKLIQ